MLFNSDLSIDLELLENLPPLYFLDQPKGGTSSHSALRLRRAKFICYKFSKGVRVYLSLFMNGKRTTLYIGSRREGQ